MHNRIHSYDRAVRTLIAAALGMLCACPALEQTAAPQRHSTNSSSHETTSKSKLATTADFIRNTLATYGEIRYTIPKTTTFDVKKYSIGEVSGCKLSFMLAHSYEGPEAEWFKEATGTSQSVIDLSKMDPTAINVLDSPQDSSAYWIRIPSTDNVPVKGYFGQPQGFIDTGVSSKEIAIRLAKAMSQAITLCGGKKSSF